MKTDHIVLSLDPMYSPLHEKIAGILGKKRYAVTSCLSKKIYLPTFKQFLAVNMIAAVSKDQAQPYQEKISLLRTYHHAYAQKVEGRTLSNEELNYMARFYVALKGFVIEKDINLVLLHNDARWYHAVAIDVCKELGINYLVTEQGLIRPFTTVIDPQGVNANSKIDFKIFSNEVQHTPKEQVSFIPKDTHDSIKSMFFFFIFLFGFTFERINKNRTVIRYMHNSYSLKKYFKRIANKLLKKKKRISVPSLGSQGSILLLLQLENDSQFLLHSPFKSNQEVINLVADLAKTAKMSLAVKLHPLDDKEYQLDDNTYYVEGKIADLARAAEAVFTINSSASIEVLKTVTPLILMGESIYAYKGVAVEFDFNYPSKTIVQAKNEVDPVIRQKFLYYLSNEYLVKGAGYSFCSKYLKHKLEQILI
ncbi:capsular polysaccharide export protein, LipB/KpsS family [Vibrio parahaemolyticus]|uniref:capsular polysaccharide export protein, LipB/KpsS family n=1 Tax=Vibrio parahaemolyticus TaxID=670 RepID=UPI00389215E3